MHPQRPLPLHRRLKRPLTRSFFAVQRRAQQCRPRRQSVAVLPSLAPHDSKARLRVVTTRRRFVAKPRTPHPIPRAAQLFKCRSANVRGRGARPLVLSLGGLRGILSFEKESIPLYPCSAKRCPPLRAARGTLPVSLFRETKSPRRDRRGLLAVLCVYF